MPNQLLHSFVPDADHLLALEPEEIGWIVLTCLKSLTPIRNETESTFGRNHFIHLDNIQDYPREFRSRILRILTEGWDWLINQGLLAHSPGETSHGWYFITRSGERINSRPDFDIYLKANLLPKALLHPILVGTVWVLFIRGEYDTAVFQAFKEVEVSVRQAAGFDSRDIGVSLMRKAFHHSSGPLTDSTNPEGERQALTDLFAGAIGSYKNPHSHRHVPIEAPEASEMILLASHLLKIVDARVLAHQTAR